MGLMSKIKGWLNIGGPKVKIVDVEQPINGKSGTVSGKANITSKREAKMKHWSASFIMEETTGKGDEKETETTVIAEHSQDCDITIPAEGTHELEFSMLYDVNTLTDKLASKGGLLGAAGKLGKLAGKFGGGDKDYYVEVEVDVVGTALDPSDKMRVVAKLDD